MPRELRVRISLTVPLPDDPTRLAQRIIAADQAIDALRSATGGSVESESEIVTPRVKPGAHQGGLVADLPAVAARVERQLIDSVMLASSPTGLRVADDAIADSQIGVTWSQPRLEVPPMDPAPALGEQGTAPPPTGEDLLDIPAFLDRRGNLNPEPSQDISQ